MYTVRKGVSIRGHYHMHHRSASTFLRFTATKNNRFVGLCEYWVCAVCFSYFEISSRKGDLGVLWIRRAWAARLSCLQSLRFACEARPRCLQIGRLSGVIGGSRLRHHGYGGANTDQRRLTYFPVARTNLPRPSPNGRYMDAGLSASVVFRRHVTMTSPEGRKGEG